MGRLSLNSGTWSRNARVALKTLKIPTQSFLFSFSFTPVKVRTSFNCGHFYKNERLHVALAPQKLFVRLTEDYFIHWEAPLLNDTFFQQLREKAFHVPKTRRKRTMVFLTNFEKTRRIRFRYQPWIWKTGHWSFWSLFAKAEPVLFYFLSKKNAFI